MEEKKKISREEYKEKILKSHRRQLSLFYRMAQSDTINLFLLAKEVIEKEKVYELIDSEREREALIKVYEDLLDFFNKHKDITKTTDIEIKVEELKTLRQEIFNLFNVLNAYEIEIAYISEAINFHMMKLSAKNMYKTRNINPVEINEIINMVERELELSTSDPNKFIETVSNILGVLPFRMSKFKYFNVLETAIKNNLKKYNTSFVEEEIESYKLLFDSTLTGDYGILFGYYFAHIQSIKNIDLNSKEYEELEQTLDKLEDVWQDIDRLFRFTYILGLITNKLISIYLIKKELESLETPGETFNKWLECMKDSREETLKKLKEDNNEELKVIETKFKEERGFLEGLDKLVEDIDGETNKAIEEEILSSMEMLAYLRDDRFSKEEALFPEDKETIDENYLSQLIDSLISYINRNLRNMGNIERRIRMRRLLSSINLPFSNSQEFLNYIRYSLDDRVVDKEEILFTIDALYYMFNNQNK